MDVAVSALLPLVDMQEHGVSILGLCLPYSTALVMWLGG